MSLTSLIWGQSQFDDAVDKATSELRLAEEDIALNLEICDQIRSKSVPPKDAARALKRRLNHKNPNVQLLALGLTDVCVKNGGDHFLSEVASKEFMDNLVSILKMPAVNLDVKNKMLRFIQNWSVAFEGKYTLGYVGQVYKELKSEGFNFPPKDMTVASSAMVDTSTAPDWIDSDVCLRCRTAFTFTNRKHHCRNCGQVFDQQCSSKTLPLPHFGITQEVRVCDGCFAKLNKRDKERPQSSDFSSGHRRLSYSPRSHRHRIARELADAELQQAIQLSLAESNPSSSHGSFHSSRPSHNKWQCSEPPLMDSGTRLDANGFTREEEEDPELKAAIEASLREANAPKPSAPVAAPYDEPEGYYRGNFTYANVREKDTSLPAQPPLPVLPNHDLNPREADAILTFNQTIEDAQSQGGSSLSRISNTHEIYDRANSLRPKLALSLDDTDRKKQMLSEMHEKLSHAVKLYDQLLTEQISHPIWRTPSSSQETSNRLPSQYHAIDNSIRPEFGERSRQHAGSPQSGEQRYQTVGYHPTYVPPPPIQNRPLVQRQSSYASEYGTATTYAHPPPPVQLPESYHQSPTPAPLGSSYQEPYPQQHHSWTQTSFIEKPASHPQQVYPPPTPAQELWPQSQQYQVQLTATEQVHQAPSQQPQPHSYPQQTAISPAVVHKQHPVSQHPLPLPTVAHDRRPMPQHLPPISPTPVTQQQYASMAAEPVHPVQSPPAQPHQSYYQPTPSSTLSRHNTVSGPSYASPASSSSSATIGRSNTIASHSHSQPQHAYVPPPGTSNPLPAFPTAPTSNPQIFTMYSPPTTGLEQTEKKEVTLIDL